MATTTTNYGLTKPGYGDTADIADINGNMDTIDGVLQGQADALGIVVDGDKTAYSSGAAIGQYIILKNSTITGCDDGLYTAAKAIPYNTSIDSTYLTAVDGGGLNALNSKFSNVSHYETSSSSRTINKTFSLSGRGVVFVTAFRTSQTSDIPSNGDLWLLVDLYKNNQFIRRLASDSNNKVTNEGRPIGVSSSGFAKIDDDGYDVRLSTYTSFDMTMKISFDVMGYGVTIT